MELVPTIVIAASACAQSPEYRCELCVDEGGSRAVPWRSIVAMECAMNPHCPCESCASYKEDWYEGALYYIIDFRNSREMLASRQQVLTTTEIDHLRQHQVVLRYLIMEYWSGWTYCVINPVPQMFDGDREFLGYTNEELLDKANTGIYSIFFQVLRNGVDSALRRVAREQGADWVDLTDRTTYNMALRRVAREEGANWVDLTDRTTYNMALRRVVREGADWVDLTDRTTYNVALRRVAREQGADWVDPTDRITYNMALRRVVREEGADWVEPTDRTTYNMALRRVVREEGAN